MKSFFKRSPHSKRKFSVMVIAPHQDDEVIGAGGKIIQTVKKGGEVYVIYVTRSASGRNLGLYRFFGVDRIISFNRKLEAKISMSIAGVPEKNLHFLGYEAQILEGYHRYPNATLTKIIQRIENDIRNLITKKRPDEIYIPAFEGGNPDHDITNFIISKIVKEVKIPTYEMPYYPVNYPDYKKGVKNSIYQEFISSKNSQQNLRLPKIIRLKMTKEERYVKFEMLKVFRSQNPHLINHMNKADKFRRLPEYNYSVPPHKGELYGKGNLIGNISFDDFKKIVKFYENKNIENN